MDSSVRRIGADWQLFIDDNIIRRSTGLDRVVHHPRSRGVVIPADRPWESVGLGPRHVHRTDDGKFIAFYRAMWFDPAIAESDPAHRNDPAHHVAAAEAIAISDDGVTWTKPNLSLVDSPAAVDRSSSFPKPIGQTRDNNLGVPFVLVADLHRHGNCRDVDRRFALRLDTGASRGVAVGQRNAEKGYFARELPDFVNDAAWAEKLTECGGTFAPRGRAIHFWDEIHREWVAIEQGVIGHWIPSRDIGRFASSDFNHWTAQTVLYPDALDSHRIDRFDEPMFLTAFCREGVVLGLLSWYHSDRSHPDAGPVFMPTDEHPDRWPWCRKGTCEMRIAISRDGGHTWDRTSSREAWIPHSREHDAFDRLVISPTPPVTVGDEDWFYMGVIDGDHLSIRNNAQRSTYYHDRFPKHQIALYTQKRNRYVSLSSPSRAATLITQPMILDGDTLQLNVDAGHGEVRVAIVSAEPFPLHDGRANVDAPHLLTDKAIEGFSFDDCIPIRTNGIEENVRFASGASLTSLKGRPVILLFQLNDADLYGFRAVSMNR